MSTWLVPLCDLSREQRDAVELSTREHRIISGAPGSGKTQVLLHRARHLIDTAKADPARMRIFIYTNVLADYIRSALNLLNLPNASVSTLDAWCREYYQRHVSSRLPWSNDERTFDWQVIREGVLSRVRHLPDHQRPFEFVLVDEGHDLDPVSFDILKAVARHVTVCIDHKQQIYDRGSTELDIAQRLGLKRANFTLLSAFRCSPYIVELSSCFIRDSEQRGAFRHQNRVSATSEMETPLVYVADSFDDERARLIEVVKTRQAKGESVAILLPNKRLVFGFAMGLTEAGLEVEIRQESWRKEAKLPALDFNSEAPKLITYHSAKGLTFDSVLLPRLVRGTFRRSTIPDTNILFVGATRATKWVFMSTQRGKELPIFESLRSLAPKSLTIQTGSRRTATPAYQPSLFPAEEETAEEETGIGDLI